MDFIHAWLCTLRPAILASFLKKVLGIRRRVVSTADGKFYIDPASHTGQAILSREGNEPEMVAVLKALLREGDTFLDLGANEGFFTVIGSRIVGSLGKVISVEPQSRLQGVLARNLEENGARNVEVVQVVVSDTPGTATLHLSPDINTGGSGLLPGMKYPMPTESVPQTTLGELLRKRGVAKVRLMKLDVEGYEYEVVLGAGEVFRSGMIENLILELHTDLLKRRGKPQADILDRLAEWGYRQKPFHRCLVLSRDPVPGSASA